MAGEECPRGETSSAAPWISPGLVKDDEIVLRTIFDPHHLENGKLTKAAIATADLETRGWSVDRKRFTSLWRLRLEHWRWRRRYSQKNPALEKCYILPIPVSAIRGLRDAGRQVISVTDFALCSNPAHAALITSVAITKKSEARKVRTMLMAALPPFVEAKAAFGPQDRWGFSRGIKAMALSALKAVLGNPQA